MKKHFSIIISILTALNLFSQQIAFRPTNENFFKDKILFSKGNFTEDFNNDGVKDYYAYLFKSNKDDSNFIYDSTLIEGYYRIIRNANGSIREKKLIMKGYFVPTIIADFNKDGRLDLVFSYSDDSIKIYYRKDSMNDDIKLIYHSNLLSVENYGIDMNNDGMLDIVGKNVNLKNTFFILYQIPGDTFRIDTLKNLIQPNIYNSHVYAHLKIGDFNSDGKKDFLIYSYEVCNYFGVYLQQDSGKFISL
jgi:hypothetical protein